MVTHIYSDGSFWQTVGRAGAGISMVRPDGREFFSAATPITASSPEEAEYRASLLGVTLAERMGAQQVVLWLDSRFVVDRLNKKSFEPNADLNQLREEIRSRLGAFQRAVVCYIHRDQNQRADFLAREGSRGRYFMQSGPDSCVAGVTPSSVAKGVFADE
jgi:probable phosphoglycerate mutase